MRGRGALRLLTLTALVFLNACGPRAATPDASSGAEEPSGEASRALAPGVEAISLLGEELRAPTQSAEAAELRAQQLAEAEADLAADSSDVENWIWVGRRQAYPGQFRKAIATYSAALERFPDEPRLLRHRGHRYVTVREFDLAIADFERAAELVAGQPDEIEPDGQPNARGIPTSTLQFNIWYHLGLAHYLKGDWEAALQAYRQCMEVSASDDSIVATAHWLYMTLRRLGRDEEAQRFLESLPQTPDVIESMAYEDLLELYRGNLTPEALIGDLGTGATLTGTTSAYGVANWYLYNDEESRAFELIERILEGQEAQWGAFGFIAAEAEVASTARS